MTGTVDLLLPAGRAPVEPPTEPGCLLLAVDVDATSPAAVELVHAAAGANAAAVVLAVSEPVPPRLRRAALETGVALVGVAPGTDWRRLHGWLTALVHGGAPTPATRALHALADATSAVCGGCVTIEDAAGQVLARAGTEAPAHRRLAVAVRANGDYLGVVRFSGVDTSTASGALTDAARVAARYLARHRAGRIDAEPHARALRALLDGAADAPAAAAQLGLRADGRFAVVAFDAENAAPDATVTPERILEAVRLYGAAFRHHVPCTVTDGAVHGLLPIESADDGTAIVDATRQVVRHIRRAIGLPIRAGVGPVVHGPQEVGRSRRLADAVLRVIAGRRSDEPVADLREVHPQVLLLELRDALAGHQRPRLGGVAKLAEHDAANGTAYLPSLRAYLDTFGDVRAAAAQVNVHVETLRYRLRRITELSGVRLDDAEDRLATHLQLRLLDR